MHVLSHRVHRDLRDFFSMGSAHSVAKKFLNSPFSTLPKGRTRRQNEHFQNRGRKVA